MTRKTAAAAAMVALFTCASAASAQRLGVGAHIGTTGVGGDVALGLNSHIAIHGTFGTYPIKPKATLSELEFEIDPPNTILTLGVDLYPGTGSFHLMGGVISGAKTTDLRGTYTGTVTVGDNTYNGSQLGPVSGSFDMKDMIPFAGIGLGRHTSKGLGFFLDLGAGLIGESDLTLVAPNTSLPAAQQAQFQADFEKERVKAEDKLRTYTKVFPMLNIGIRIGL